MEDSSAMDAVLRHARDLSQQEKTLRSAVDAFRAAHPVLGDAPHEDLLRVRGDISERARVCDELNAAAPAVYAAVARWQVLAHQAPCNAAATAAALDSASGQNAFINAALRIHMETGAVPAPAGDGLGNETDDACMKCGRAADDLSISPDPASATSGGANCALGAPNQCTCFAGRMYRACADCWSAHTNQMLAANVRRAIAGEELSCCVPCLVCGDMACSFRIKKAVVIVPAAPCAAVPPPPQLLLQQQQQQQQRLVVVQTLSTPPPPPPPEVPAWQQPHAFNFEVAESEDFFGNTLPAHSPNAFDLLGADTFAGGAMDYPQNGGIFGCQGDTQLNTAADFAMVQGLTGSDGLSPTGGYMQMPQPQQQQPSFETLHTMLEELATCLKGMNARNTTSAKAVHALVNRFRDPLAYSGDDGVGKRSATPPSSPMKPVRRRGARSHERACRYCERVGHNIRGCPKKKADIQEEAQRIVAARDAVVVS